MIHIFAFAVLPNTENGQMWIIIPVIMMIHSCTFSVLGNIANANAKIWIIIFTVS